MEILISLNTLIPIVADFNVKYGLWIAGFLAVCCIILNIPLYYCQRIFPVNVTLLVIHVCVACFFFVSKNDIHNVSSFSLKTEFFLGFHLGSCAMPIQLLHPLIQLLGPLFRFLRDLIGAAMLCFFSNFPGLAKVFYFGDPVDMFRSYFTGHIQYQHLCGFWRFL